MNTRGRQKRQKTQPRQTTQSRSNKRRRSVTLAVMGAVVIGLSASLSAAVLTGDDGDTTTTVSRPTPTSTSPSSTTTERPIERFELIGVDELPPEGRVTLVLIEAGGPFPYEEDGREFENREGNLPSQPAGYYSEFTVETPGSDDRGARRIVAGDGGERYYTDDHYESFSVIDTESGS